MNLFQKLLACGRCQWLSASASDRLVPSDSQQIRVLVRGDAQKRTSSGECLPVRPGDVMTCQPGEEVMASEHVVFASLDVAKLMDCVHNSSDTLLVALVSEILDDAEFPHVANHQAGSDLLAAVPPRTSNATSPSGWFSPVQAAIKLQAKRKGFSVCTEITDGLQHILSQEDISMPEKLERCRVLVLNHAEDFVESLEALVDLTGACSALHAFWTHSSAPTPESLLQLAPIIILLSLTAAHAARRGALQVFSPKELSSP